MAEREQIQSASSLFATGLSPNEVEINGIKVDIWYLNSRNQEIGFAVVLGGPLGSAMATAARKRPDGFYARVWLPESLLLDLVVRSRDKLDGARDDIDAYFHISATSELIAKKHLEGPLGDSLTTLAEGHFILMRDEHIEFGPLLDLVDAGVNIDLAVQAVANFDPNWHTNEAELEAYEGDDAEFCFFCGFNVCPGTLQCPQCSSDLSDDDED